MKEIIEIINWIFGKHKILKVILYIPVLASLLICMWIGMCIGGGQG